MSSFKREKVLCPKTKSVRSKILLKIIESVRSEKVKVPGPKSNKNQLESDTFRLLDRILYLLWTGHFTSKKTGRFCTFRPDTFRL